MRKGKDPDPDTEPYLWLMGSGSRRPKNMRILRIRIPNADFNDACSDHVYMWIIAHRSGFEILDWKQEATEFVEGDELRLNCAASRYTDKQRVYLKGIVPRDFRIQVFSWISFPANPYVSHLGRSDFLRKFSEIFAAQYAPLTTVVANGKNLQSENFLILLIVHPWLVVVVNI
jgi:hypothetical protein